MKKEIKVIVTVSLIINIILTVVKLLGGYLGNTISLVSDGFNSLADIIISLVLILTLNLANKKPDKDHPYGHEKYEGIVSFILGLFLLLTASFILIGGIKDLILYDKNISYTKPHTFTMYIALGSILLKTFVYYINLRGYRKYHQVSLKAESYNHLGDIFATTASLIGIIFASKGYIYIDYVASVLIGIVILKNSYSVIKESISFLVDEAPKKEYMKELKASILNVEGVLAVDELKAIKHVSKIYVDVEISVNRDLTLIQAHEIAERVHISVETLFPDVIHCMVHYNPKKA